MSSMKWELINNLNAISDNEDIIIEYLLQRLEAGITYTWVGPVLLSLNPEQNISPNSKGNDFVNSSGVLQTNAEPHIFAVAASAHYKILNNLGRSSQVILISGDSGAGKTFNANQAINFLAAINKSSSICPLDERKVEKFVEKIVNACPLITAFSTASTANNSRSSRHGNLIRFEYKDGLVSGASIKSFLFERTRVTKGNDNFVIFYQLLCGLSDPELENLGLSREESYSLLGTNPYVQKELDHNFQETCNAINAIGFSESERKEIFKIIALLIHLGNIKFEETGDGSTVVDIEKEESRKALEKASLLAGISENNLKGLLTTALISTQSKWRRHTTYRRNLGSKEICRNRLFSIIRHLYDNLFNGLIERINQTLSSGNENHSWLGILDIFGFESFTVNGMEELSINYANERLQLYFMREYLELGHRELLEEGLTDLPTPGIIDIYRDRLNAIEVDLFPILNDASQHLIQYHLQHLQNKFLKPENFNILKLSTKNESFIINHYSQPVEYSLQDLLFKNNDKVPSELQSTFIESSNSLLKKLSKEIEDLNNDNKIYVRKGTTLAKVKRSLDVLLKELKKCDTNYVKCIRPRFIKSSWDKEDLKKQLIYTGILDALPLARCKYLVRLGYDEFNSRYSKKSFDRKNSLSLELPHKVQFCKNILQEITDEKTLTSMVHFGKRLIFLKESFFLTLEGERRIYRNQSIIKIQKFWKKYQLQKTANLNKNRKSDSSVECYIKELFSNDLKIQIDPLDHKDRYLIDIQNVTDNPSKIKTAAQKINECPENKSNHLKTDLDIRPSQYGHGHSICFDRNTFFYKNRILSRQRLAEIPVRFHTRLTCLPNSHRLPRSELPNGLEDCL